MRISIVVPTYNEKENVDELMSRIDKVLNGLDYEIVVVDDNSPDGTAERVAELSVRYPIKLIRREGKQGLISAVFEGINSSGGEHVVIMDADLQHPPEVIRELLKVVDSCDLAVASRYVKGGGVEGFPFVRRVISLGATYLARILIPQARKVRDPLSGFFLVRREVIKDVKPAMSRGYKVLLEVLASRKGLKVCEVPYVFRSRLKGESKLGWREILNYVKQLLLLMPDYYKFAVVGITGVLVNLGLMTLLEYLFTIPHIVASAVGIEASLTNNFIWNDVWTFRNRKGGSRLKKYLKYHLSTLVGNASQYLTSQLIYYLLLRESVISQTTGIIVGFIANYLISSKYVWSYNPHLDARHP